MPKARITGVGMTPFSKPGQSLMPDVGYESLRLVVTLDGKEE